ncbi:ribonuclease H-like domain-containing protein [Tanacetum coccineum]
MAPAVRIIQALLRRNDGNTITKSGTDLHKGYVVPYNARFLRRYQSHLFKCINKGLDRVIVAVDGEEVDEIKDFYDCRYLLACEATWRIYGFDIHYRTPPIERLPFHLQDEQSVIFDATESIDYILEKYLNIMFGIHRKEFGTKEKEVKGPKEWSELKKYDNVVYPTYRDACYAHGLLQDDKEYIDGLLEASQWGIGDYLRSFFVMLLMTNSMSRSEFVCEKTWHVMAAYMENVERIKQNKPGNKKTYIYKTMSAVIRSQGDIVLNVASSGIAALLLECGRIAHSRFAIPINILEDSMCHIPADSDLADLIRQSKLIIWDEAPMIQSYCYEAFDRTLRDICRDLQEEAAPAEEQSSPPAPKTAKQLTTKRNHERVKSILLLAIPDEYLLKFHNVPDAKSLWAAIKSRFGGNDESKTMQRNVLKHQFENFTTAPNESLDKAYDSQIALIMRNNPDIDQTDIDDLYSNLRVYEDEMKRSSSSTSNSQNLAFLSSENTSSTNEVSTTSGNFRVNTAGGTNSSSQVSSTPGADKVVCSFFAQQTINPPLDNEDLQQIDQDDNWILDGSNDFDELVNYALMAISSPSSLSSSDNEIQNCSKQCLKSFKTLQKNYDNEREKHSRARLEIQGYKLALESLESRILRHEKNELAWGEKYEFQNYELNQMSAKDKNGLGYGTQLDEMSNKSETDSEISMSVFEVRSSDEEITPANDRFSKADGYHVVPPPITGNFLTPRADISFAGLDEYAIRKKIIESKTTEPKDDTSESKTSETVGKTNEVEKSKPKINRDKVIIEDWNSDDEDDVSEVNTVNPVKTNETQTVKTQVDKIGQISQKEGIGFKKIKACFVCKSTDHLIKDCDFYAKKSPEPKLKTVVNTGQRVVKPVWDNAKRVNHQKISNKLKYPQARRTFVPSGVLTRTGLVNPVRPNGKRAVHTVSTARPISTARPVSTARPFAPKIAQTGSAIRPIYPRMDNVRPRASYSPIKRSYYTKPAFRPKNLKQDVKTSGVKNMTTAGTRAVVNTGKGKMDNALKKSRWVWRPKGNYMDHESKEKGSFILKKFEYGNPESILQDHAVVDSGCSSHMTGNKAYLSDYEDYNGGFVAFGSDPKGGKITGKGKIRTANLDFDDVYFVDELKFNLFSVSQMCDKKNSVLFTNTECLILSPSFKFLDESQVVLRAPRQNGVYGLDLKNIVPSGGKSPSISFMRPFGCPLTILNTLDSLGKFDGKSDEGYLLGYSTSIKVFRVYNKSTKRVEENLHINFLEDQPNVAGTGPNWMFDLDFLTNSINYIPVSVENQVIMDAGTQDSSVAGSSRKDKGPTHEYILLPLQPHKTRIPVKDVV